ncbi:DUF2326 domain-containing protein [Bacteroides xylanisolvens]|uniref:DUF2326 domain-containing protein n=1 Tax=Bacteroides xylanisolvens TaxID=371601 RepID=UPI0002FB68AA|nr:DUF2326 domain-containing protein [Bacteroides xylanisolvens]
MELLLNSGKYLVIRRGIEKPSKISFKLNEIPLTNFDIPTEWDEENVAFEEAKDMLNTFLGYDVLTNWPYRKSISYFLRSQKDYLDVFQLNKFKGKHIGWKPFVFDLLGFDGSLVEKKLHCDDEIVEKKSEIATLQKQASIDIAERDKIIGLIEIKSEEKDRTEKEIDKFNFYSQDVTVTRELIDSIDTQLQTLNSERYRLGYEIKKINSSLEQTSVTVRLDKLKELYNEVELFFPESLSKQYEELERFTDAISSERRKYLEENLSFLKKEYAQINDAIKVKEQERSDKISILTEVDVYDKFKVYQKELASLEAELSLLQEKLRLIDNSSTIRTEIEKLKDERKEYIDKIREAIDGRAHADINKIFNQIVTEVTDTNAIISIKQNSDANVEFEADYQTTTHVTTSEADGTSYKKLLCVAFDIALLVSYSSHSFYRFVYHDGVLEGLDDRVKQRLIMVTQRICSEYGLQYILSLIDSDIPKNVEDSNQEFPMDAVCLNLNDLDDSGKLFMRSF